MQAILADKLRSVTFDLRKTEKEHFTKVQELHGGTQHTVQSDDQLCALTEEEATDF